MLTATLLLLGAVLITMCLVERHVTRLPVSPAAIYLVVGWIAGAMARPHVQLPPTAPQRANLLVMLTETAVLISLFAVGLRLRTPFTLKGWRVAATLASLGMLWTIALAALLAAWLCPELGWIGALLLAGILAPTDPVLASEVQIRSAHDRDAVRLALTAEGGMNDGTALPFVVLALGLAGQGGLAPDELAPAGLHWAWHDLAWPIAGGALLGWLFGQGLGHLVHALLRRGHGLGWDELMYLGVITLAYGLSRLSATSSFLFVFAAALGLFRLSAATSDELTRAGVDGARLADRLLAFGHRCERLVEVTMVLMLGFAMAWIAWSWRHVAYALLLVGVVRPASVYLSVHRRQMPRAHRRVLAWFGIRGVGSLFYLAWVIDAGIDPALSARLVQATLPTIAISILLHGVTATPLMTIYRRREAMRRWAARRAARRLARDGSG